MSALHHYLYRCKSLIQLLTLLHSFVRNGPSFCILRPGGEIGLQYRCYSDTSNATWEVERTTCQPGVIAWWNEKARTIDGLGRLKASDTKNSQDSQSPRGREIRYHNNGRYAPPPSHKHTHRNRSKPTVIPHEDCNGAHNPCDNMYPPVNRRWKSHFGDILVHHVWVGF